MRITPHPYIEVDIRNARDRKNGDGKTKLITFNKKDIFAIKILLKELVKNLYTDNQLFFYTNNGILKCNPQLANSFRISYTNYRGQKIDILPMVIPSTENEYKVYEGVLIYLNGTMDDNVMLTSQELRYVLYELEEMNIDTLCLEMFNCYFIHREDESKEITFNRPNKDINTEKLENQEIVDIKVKSKNTIPDI